MSQALTTMKKPEKILLVLALVISLGSLWYGWSQSKDDSLGNIFKESNSYSLPLTYTIATVGTNPQLLLSRATSSRSYGSICSSELSTSTVWLYKQVTSTGVVVSQGNPIYPTSTSSGKLCAVYDSADPYTGTVWGIANTTTTVYIETLQR